MSLICDIEVKDMLKHIHSLHNISREVGYEFWSMTRRGRSAIGMMYKSALTVFHIIIIIFFSLKATYSSTETATGRI